MDVRSTRVLRPPLRTLWRWGPQDTMDTAVEHRETSSQPSSPPNTPLQRFGATVRQYRKQQRLSQRALAAKMGWRDRYLSQIELGRHNIAVLTLLRLASALDISAWRLLAPLETCAPRVPHAAQG